MDGWTAVVGFILGYVAKAIADWLQHRRTVEAAREERTERRRDEIAVRRNDLQRETLIELQEVIARLARATARGYHEDVMASRKKGGAWSWQQLTEKANEGSFQSQQRSTILVARIADDKSAHWPLRSKALAPT